MHLSTPLKQLINLNVHKQERFIKTNIFPHIRVRFQSFFKNVVTFQTKDCHTHNIKTDIQQNLFLILMSDESV